MSKKLAAVKSPISTVDVLSYVVTLVPSGPWLHCCPCEPFLYLGPSAPAIADCGAGSLWGACDMKDFLHPISDAQFQRTGRATSRSRCRTHWNPCPASRTSSGTRGGMVRYRPRTLYPAPGRLKKKSRNENSTASLWNSRHTRRCLVPCTMQLMRVASLMGLLAPGRFTYIMMTFCRRRSQWPSQRHSCGWWWTSSDSTYTPSGRDPLLHH